MEYYVHGATKTQEVDKVGLDGGPLARPTSITVTEVGTA